MPNHEMLTLSILSIGSSLLLAASLHLVGRLISENPSLRLWTLGAAANAGAYVLLALRGYVPELLSLVLADILMVAGASLLYRGNREFQGLTNETRWPWYWTLTAVTGVVIFYFTYLSPNRAARVVTVSIAVAIPLMTSVLVLLQRGDSRDLRVRQFVAITYGTMVIFLLIRAIGTLFIESSGLAFTTAVSPLHKYSLIFGITLNGVLGICLPLLLSGKMKLELAENEERYRTLYNKTPAIMHSIDAQARLINVSDLWVAALGYSREEAIGRVSYDFLTPASREVALNEVLPVFLKQGICTDVPYQVILKNGRVRDFLMSAFASRDANGRIVGGLVVMNDVTEQLLQAQKIAQSEQRMELALDGADLGLWDLDLVSKKFNHNPRLITMFGYMPEELEIASETSFALIHPDDLEQFRSDFQAALKGKTPLFSGEYRYHHKSGHWVWVFCRGKVVERGRNGRVARMAGTTQDISERKNSELEIHRLAFHDALTQLPNRRLFNDRFHQAMVRAQRDKSQIALMFIDLDKFKPVNDAHGHAIGDWLLQAVAQRILLCLRAMDTAARVGGDEFLVLLSEVQFAQDAAGVAEKIRLALQQPLIAPGNLSLTVSCSIGLALYADPKMTEEDLLRLGDDAMYRAKRRGGNVVELAGEFTADPAQTINLDEISTAGRSMVRLTLEAAFFCGNPTIDDEHRELFGLANVLLATTATCATEPLRFKAAFDDLLGHVVAHFAHEEKILHDSGFEHLAEQSQLHRAIVEQAVKLRHQSDQKDAMVGSLVDTFVTDVVIRHMLHEVHSYVEHFSNGTRQSNS